jgi:probable HAF family extracellular repeat protein
MSTLSGVPDVYSHATGINDLGQVIGFWDDQAGRATPFVWNPVRRSPVILPRMAAPPYSVFTAPSAINNRSWVVGADGQPVLWVPTPTGG